MGTPTLTPIANLTLAAGQSDVYFTGITQGFRDLVLVLSGTAASTTGVVLQFNGDTGANYSIVYATGDGTSATSGTAVNYGWIDGAGVFGTSVSVTTINIMDYSATDKHKSVLSRTNNTGWGVRMLAGRWASNSNITSIRVNFQSAAAAAGSTFALYGVIA